MKSKVKKIVKVLFVSIIFASCFHCNIFAAEAETVVSGKCGDSVNWEYDADTYTLTISGTGKMYHYSSGSMPWADYSYQIQNLVFEGDVTSIGDSCFEEHSSLSSISWTDSIKSIGEKSFRKCSSLTTLTLPENLTYAGKYSFAAVPVGTVTIPDSMTVLGNYMFSACKSLTTVNLPDTVKQIGTATFNGCSNLKNIMLPEGLEIIGYSAFVNCSSLETVSIPSTVTLIDSQAYAGCKNLKSAYLYCQMGELEWKDTFPSSCMIYCFKNSSAQAMLDYHGISYQFMDDYLGNLKEIEVTTTDYIGDYDGNSHVGNIVVENIPDGEYEIYYCTYPSLYWAFQLSQGVYVGYTQTKELPEFIDVGTYSYDYYICAKGYAIKKGTINVTIKKYDSEVSEFSDVKEHDWFYSAVQYVYNKGLMSGYNGEFKPYDNMTRAMMVTTIYRMEGEPEVTDYTASEIFSDIEKDSWYEDAVNWAYNEGITTGYPDRMLFGSYDNVTREQLAVFLYRYAGMRGMDVTVKGDITNLKNHEQVSDYAEDGIGWAVGSGLISGIELEENGEKVYDLAPQGNATRAQLATILMRFCE